MKFDMHCHTKEGSIDAKLPIEGQIRILRKKGFDGMLVSDHDSYNGYRAYRKNELKKKYPDFVVLQGIEYDTIDAGHILCILPDGITLPIFEIKGMPVKILIELVHHLGGILGPAHPFGIRYQSFFNTMKQQKQIHYMKQFDFVERYNACEDADSNHQADYLTRIYKKPGFGGSDAHKAECAGLAYTLFPDGVSIRSNSDLIRFIKEDGTGVQAGGGYYGKTVRNKIGFWYEILMQTYWVYIKGGGLINKVRHNSHMKHIFLDEISKKKRSK